MQKDSLLIATVVVLLVGVVFGGVAGVGVGAADEHEEEPDDGLFIIVSDEEGDALAADITILQDGDVVEQGTTDGSGDGLYYEEFPSGEYTIEAETDDGSDSITVTVEEGEFDQAVLTVFVNNLFVSTIDAEGEPVSTDVSVLDDGTEIASGTSDSDGEIAFDVSEGEYVLEATIGGETVTESVEITDTNEITGAVISADSDGTGDGETRVLVVLVDGDGELIEGHVEITDGDGNVLVDETVNGELELDVEPGEYTVEATVDGETQEETVTVSDGETESPTFGFADEEEVEPDENLFVNPIDEEGEVVSSEVEVLQDGEVIASATVTNDDVGFEVNPGEYTVSVVTEDGEEYTETVTLGDEMEVVAVEVFDESISGDIGFNTAVALSDTDGEQISGEVTVIQGGEVIDSETVEAGEQAEFDLESGEYVFEAETDEGTVTKTASIDAGEINDVLLIEGEGERILTVELVDGDGESITGEVTVDGETQTGEVVEFGVEDGEYTIEAAVDGQTTTESVEIDGQDETATLEIEGVDDGSFTIAYIAGGIFLLGAIGAGLFAYKFN